MGGKKWGGRKYKKDYNEYMKKYMQSYRAKPQIKEKIKAYYKLPEVRKRQFAYLREYMRTHPQYRNTEKQKVLRRLRHHDRRLKTKKAKNSLKPKEWLTIRNTSPICPMCGRFVGCEDLTIDHIIPLSKGGAHKAENIQALCFNCNSSKHTTIPRFVN